MNIISLFLVTYLIVKQFKYENELYQKIILQQNQEIEQQRQKSENLLLNILPEETADELKEKGFATPKHYDLVTVLFTDFKGFTQIAEKITPQEVIENLNTCFLAFDEICEKYGLEKIKTIGDSYMCAGGVPTPNTTNPVDVVLAGLAMQAWMAQWAEKKRVKGEPSWELRLGIHSGEAVAGVVGKNKFAYDIWGDTVNLASRMESSGEVGKVNISDTTYALIKHRFQCVHRGEIQAKNKGKIEMYFVEKHL
jgi:class 3 adenylate cyclase